MSQPTSGTNPTAPDLQLESPVPFVDRRNTGAQRRSAGIERRQFTNSYEGLSEEAAELGRAVDQYKMDHHRRFISYEELLSVVRELGYRKP